MTIDPPLKAPFGDAEAFARELAGQLAALSTPLPGENASFAVATGGNLALPAPTGGLDLNGPRSVLENAARFVSPRLPAEARFRSAKALLLRALRIVTRDQTAFNSGLVEAVRQALQALGELELGVNRTANVLRAEHAGLTEGAERRSEERLGAESLILRNEMTEALRGLASAREQDNQNRLALGREVVSSQQRLDEMERDRDTRAERLAREKEQAEEIRKRQEQEAGELRSQLRQMRLEWTVLRNELKKLPTHKPEGTLAAVASPGIPSAGDPLRAGLYVDFEETFRGSEEEIRIRQEADAVLFRNLPGPVADLGCGRGEFVRILGNAGIDAMGCDANPMMVERAKEQGLLVEQADLFAWLEARSPDSLGGITAYQVIEHLPPAALFELMELAVSRLAPGGRLLLETINPESVYAMRWFWMDLTHVRPVPAPSMAQLMRGSGFRDVTIHYRSPVPAAQSVALRDVSPALAPVLDLLFAPQDYAITGLK